MVPGFKIIFFLAKTRPSGERVFLQKKSKILQLRIYFFAPPDFSHHNFLLLAITLHDHHDLKENKNKMRSCKFSVSVPPSAGRSVLFMFFFLYGEKPLNCKFKEKTGFFLCNFIAII